MVKYDKNSYSIFIDLVHICFILNYSHALRNRLGLFNIVWAVIRCPAEDDDDDEEDDPHRRKVFLSSSLAFHLLRCFLTRMLISEFIPAHWLVQEQHMVPAGEKLLQETQERGADEQSLDTQTPQGDIDRLLLMRFSHLLHKTNECYLRRANVGAA